ncbi:hypothetical protein [Streptomyces sp. NPDC007346]|uniref:hypothetical protein n=1 Tax=Streptomyces sp. NPDC007346 TaxID=3154682 RepID=UPI003451D7CC
MTDTPMTPDRPTPVELTAQQLEALIDAGNRALNDHYHEDQCHCDAWPTSCVSSDRYFMGAWDTDAFAIGVPAVLGVWESLRTNRDAAKVAELKAEVDRLRGELSDATAELAENARAMNALRRHRDTAETRATELEALKPARRDPRGDEMVRRMLRPDACNRAVTSPTSGARTVRPAVRAATADTTTTPAPTPTPPGTRRAVVPSRKRKPWMVVLAGPDVKAESGHTSELNAYSFVRASLGADSPAETAEILHWEDGRWILRERLSKGELP